MSATRRSDGARELRTRHALLFAHDDVHCEQDGGGRVDRHRGRDPVERDLPEQVGQVVHRVDGDADPPDLALRHRVVGVVAHLGGEVERGREAHLSGGEQAPEALVGLLRGPEAGILAHGPEPAGVHVGVDAAGERELARLAEIPCRVAGPVARAVHRLRTHLAAAVRVRGASPRKLGRHGQNSWGCCSPPGFLRVFRVSVVNLRRHGRTVTGPAARPRRSRDSTSTPCGSCRPRSRRLPGSRSPAGCAGAARSVRCPGSGWSHRWRCPPPAPR
jgi:hypothetical protein